MSSTTSSSSKPGIKSSSAATSSSTPGIKSSSAATSSSTPGIKSSSASTSVSTSGITSSSTSGTVVSSATSSAPTPGIKSSTSDTSSIPGRSSGVAPNPGSNKSSSVNSSSGWLTTFFGLPLFPVVSSTGSGFLGFGIIVLPSSGWAGFVAIGLAVTGLWDSGFLFSTGGVTGVSSITSSISSTILFAFGWTVVSSSSLSTAFLTTVFLWGGLTSMLFAVGFCAICGLLVFDVLTDDGIITGPDIGFLSLVSNKSIFIPVKFLSVSAWVVLLIFWTTPFTLMTSWYFGDSCSKTAFTFIGRQLIMIFNCSSLYCVAMFAKSSANFSGCLAIFL